ncbi:hypothetical protein ACFLSA_05210 [Bacteroidota bacterium]
MKKVTVELRTNNAYRILKDLEQTEIIRVIEEGAGSRINEEVKFSNKYAGKLPVQIAEELKKHIQKSRNQWKEIT